MMKMHLNPGKNVDKYRGKIRDSSAARHSLSRPAKSICAHPGRKGECRPKAAFDYPEHISTKRQGFIRVYTRSIALFDLKGRLTDDGI